MCQCRCCPNTFPASQLEDLHPIISVTFRNWQSNGHSSQAVYQLSGFVFILSTAIVHFSVNSSEQHNECFRGETVWKYAPLLPYLNNTASLSFLASDRGVFLPSHHKGVGWGWLRPGYPKPNVKTISYWPNGKRCQLQLTNIIFTASKWKSLAQTIQKPQIKGNWSIHPHNSDHVAHL